MKPSNNASACTDRLLRLGIVSGIDLLAPRKRPPRYRVTRSSASIGSHVSFRAWSQRPLSPSSTARSATGAHARFRYQ